MSTTARRGREESAERLQDLNRGHRQDDREVAGRAYLRMIDAHIRTKIEHTAV